MDSVRSELLQCPICFEYPQAEVYQCCNGHSLCSDCAPSLDTCPQCKLPFDNPKLRNRALEALLENMEIECKYRGNGCERRFVKADIPTHESICVFKPLNFCREIGFSSCSYGSAVPEMVAVHLKVEHNVETITPKQKQLKVSNFNAAGNEPPKLWMVDLKTLGASGSWILIHLTKTTDRSRVFFGSILIGKEETECRMYKTKFRVYDRFNKLVISWKAAPSFFKDVSALREHVDVVLSTSFLSGSKDHVDSPWNLKFDAEVKKRSPRQVRRDERQLKRSNSTKKKNK